MNIDTITNTILDTNSTPDALRGALDAFVRRCSQITGIQPDPSFNAWAEDALLDNGVAINPHAAAHCAVDYQRSVVFIRGVYAAINSLKQRFPNTPIEILYAGCGPFATLLLPLLGKFSPGELNVCLLDIHQQSLDGVNSLLAHFNYSSHAVETIRGDACHYQHPGKLHLVVGETMQKALEQEPQFALTANLAPQLYAAGVFIPQRIEVDLCLTDTERNDASTAEGREIPGRHQRKYTLAKVCTLSPEHAFEQMQQARAHAEGETLQLQSTRVKIPIITDIDQLEAALFTHICVFERYRLTDYESQITLPRKCHEIASLAPGDSYQICYKMGSYPAFELQYLQNNQ